MAPEGFSIEPQEVRVKHAMGVPELARRLGIKNDCLYRVLWAFNIKPSIDRKPGKKGGRPGRLLSAEQVADIYRRLREAGHKL
jgi:hypothetical protein